MMSQIAKICSGFQFASRAALELKGSGMGAYPIVAKYSRVRIPVPKLRAKTVAGSYAHVSK